MKSIQDELYSHLTCFGCGPANPNGLQIKSFRAEGGVAGRFAPRPEHDNGLGFLNGGIITTVLDCHCAAVVVVEALARGWRAPDGSDWPMPFITAGLETRFLRPTPLGPDVELWAHASLVGEQEVVVEGELRQAEKVRAALRATWKRFRPR
jgi:acyl-coenzyme A thioesterase PaaI-like protein